MKKQITIFVIIAILLIIGLSGCNEISKLTNSLPNKTKSMVVIEVKP